MNKNKKHLLIFSIILTVSLFVLWGVGYWDISTEVPWPGGESGLERMQQPYFVESRNEFYIQQSLILSVLLIISLLFCYLIWVKKKALVDKISFGLMIWVTICLFSIIFISIFAIFPLGIGAVLSLSAIVWGIWVKRWKLPLLPFFYSILLALYSIHHFSEWFSVYGD
jgi:hypothetical protein